MVTLKVPIVSFSAMVRLPLVRVSVAVKPVEALMSIGTLTPPAGAAAPRVTVKVALPPSVTAVSVELRLMTVGGSGSTSLMVMVTLAGSPRV